jgi:hypothetical protein
LVVLVATRYEGLQALLGLVADDDVVAAAGGGLAGAAVDGNAVAFEAQCSRGAGGQGERCTAFSAALWAVVAAPPRTHLAQGLVVAS